MWNLASEFPSTGEILVSQKGEVMRSDHLLYGPLSREARKVRRWNRLGRWTRRMWYANVVMMALIAIVWLTLAYLNLLMWLLNE